jgi:hypothetical protein
VQTIFVLRQTSKSATVVLKGKLNLASDLWIKHTLCGLVCKIMVWWQLHTVLVGLGTYDLGTKHSVSTFLILETINKLINTK